MITRAVQLMLCIGSFLLGLLVGLAPTFDVQERLTAGDLLNALMTLLVAIAIGVVFQKSFTQNAVEKELMITQGREVMASMKEARGVFVRAYANGPTESSDHELVGALRLVSAQLSALEVACQKESATSDLRDARAAHRRYRKATTDRVLATGTSYSAEELSLAEGAFGAFSGAMLQFTIHINRG